MTPKQSDSYLCLHCLKEVTPLEKTKRTFMGFPKLICPLCQKESRYPLTAGYTALYGLLLILNVFYAFYVFSQGGGRLNPIGCVVVIYVVISLVESARIKRDIEAIKNRAPGEQLTDFRSYKRMMIAEDPAYASMRDRDLQAGYKEWLATVEANNARKNAAK